MADNFVFQTLVIIDLLLLAFALIRLIFNDKNK